MFTLNNNMAVTVDPEYLLVPEFAAIWKADATRHKAKALKEFKYVWFYADFKSPIRRTTSEGDMHQAVCDQILQDAKFKPTKRVKDALLAYAKLQDTKSLKLFRAAENVGDQMLTYLSDIGPGTIEEKFDKVFKVMDKVPSVIENIESSRKAVEKEQQDKITKDSTGKALGSRENPRKRKF